MEKKSLDKGIIKVFITAIFLLTLIKVGFCQWEGASHDMSFYLKNLGKKSNSIFQNEAPKFAITLADDLSEKWCFVWNKNIDSFLISGEDYFPSEYSGGDVLYVVKENWYDEKSTDFAFISIELCHNTSKESLKAIAENDLIALTVQYREKKVINRGVSLKVNGLDAYEITIKRNALEDVVYLKLNSHILRIRLWSYEKTYNQDRKDFLKVIYTLKKL